MTIIEARNLKAVDANGLSDPYIKVKIHGEKDITIYKTKTMKKTLNPFWNELFVVPIPVVVDPQRRFELEFTVKDQNFLSGSEVIGLLKLDIWKQFTESQLAQCSTVSEFSIDADIWTKPGDLHHGEDGCLHLHFNLKQVNDAELLKQKFQRTASGSSLSTVDNTKSKGFSLFGKNSRATSDNESSSSQIEM